MSGPIATKKSHRVYQVINLKEVFGISFFGRDALKKKIEQALVDNMKERIASGVDVNGSPMKSYSKNYKESVDYIAARKTGVVNLSLSGDMLGAIGVPISKGNRITIGFAEREQELKANRHMRGDGVPVREFFGIGQFEIDAVKKQFEAELSSNKREPPRDPTSQITMVDILREIREIDATSDTRRFKFKAEEE